MGTRCKGTVRSVLSGDTIVIVGAAQGGPPPEKQIALNGIMAPRLARAKDAKDEPFAWQSREFLRNLCIGKAASFVVENVNPTNKRESGTVTLFPGEENLAMLVVANGWARTRGMRDDQRPSYWDELTRLEQQAMAEGKGVHTRDPAAIAAAVRELPNMDDFNALSFLESLSGDRVVPAIIEQFRDGHTFRAWLLPSFHFVTVFLSGIQCPGVKKDAQQGQEIAQPYAREARHFSETRLLNRAVDIKLEGVDKFNNFYGTVLYSKGNISEELMANGLASIANWSIPYCSSAAKLREAEKRAKQGRLRIWTNYQPPAGASSSSCSQEFVGKVLEIASGDTLLVQDAATNEEKRISLSSIRVPRPARKGTDARDDKGEPLAFEAKDFLRSKAIGKKVKVIMEYTRDLPARNETVEKRPFATIMVNDVNLAELMVENGLARTIRHRQDEERSSCYDALLQAEERAKAAGKGLHAKEAPSVRHINDLSGAEAREKAKGMLPLLQRKGRLHGVVDFVMNGARMKVLLAREGCMVVVALAGVRCPAAPRNDGTPGEEFGHEAMSFTREKCLQHDVELEIETVDRVGCFIGTVYVNKKNLGTMLLEEGLAWLTPAFMADRTLDSGDLVTAEANAKANKKKVWANFQKEDVSDAVEDVSVSKADVALRVCEVTSAVRFFAHVSGEADLSALEQFMAPYIARVSVMPDNVDYKPKIGEICGARFQADGQWYRTRVERRVNDGYEVYFIDYGNVDFVPHTDIRPPDHGFPSVNTLRPQAREMRMAFLKAPPADDEDNAVEAGLMLKSLVWDKALTAQVVYKEGKVECVLLTETDSPTTVNAAMLRSGLATIDKKVAKRLAAAVAPLRADEDYARQNRLYLWQYGDACDSDDDEPRGLPRRGDGKGRS